MSIITKLTQHDTFIEKVRQQISAKIEGTQADADTQDGIIEGTVTHYHLGADLVFGEESGEGVEWSIPFKVTGDATIGYKRSGSDGEYGDYEKNSRCNGYVDVILPTGTKTGDLDEIVSSVDVSVRIESWG